MPFPILAAAPVEAEPGIWLSAELDTTTEEPRLSIVARYQHAEQRTRALDLVAQYGRHVESLVEAMTDRLTQTPRWATPRSDALAAPSPVHNLVEVTPK